VAHHLRFPKAGGEPVVGLDQAKQFSMIRLETRTQAIHFVSEVLIRSLLNFELGIELLQTLLDRGSPWVSRLVKAIVLFPHHLPR